MGTLKEFDVGNLIESNLESTKLSGEIHLETNSLNLGSAKGFMHAFLTEGSLNALNYDTLKLDLNWNKGFFTPFLLLNSNNINLTTNGNIIISDSLKELNLSGNANQINLKALTNTDHLSNSLIDINYDLNLKGTDSNNAFGLLTIDLPNTIVDGDTLKAHQIYADYNASTEYGKALGLHLHLLIYLFMVTLSLQTYLNKQINGLRIFIIKLVKKFYLKVITVQIP